MAERPGECQFSTPRPNRADAPVAARNGVGGDQTNGLGTIDRQDNEPDRGGTAVNQAAHDAVEKAWTLTVKVRALCPHASDSAVGMSSYESPDWYRQRKAVYFVKPDQPLKQNDVREINDMGTFVNRSFVVAMAAILEAFDIVPYKQNPDRSKAGGDHAQLTKWLRNRFAHGDWEFDAGNKDHVQTLDLQNRLFPSSAATGLGFAISIDTILEPLKDGVLEYIRACA